MSSYAIHCFTYEMRDTLLPRLATAIADSGGWMLERKALSEDRAELLFELHPRTLLDLYAALAASGIELTRAAQHTLIALCARRKHLGRRDAAAAQTLSIRLEIRFLEDAPLSAILSSSSSIA